MMTGMGRLGDLGMTLNVKGLEFKVCFVAVSLKLNLYVKQVKSF